MTSDPADRAADRPNPAADVTSSGDPLTTGREAPSSGSFGEETASVEDVGTAAGDPLSGTGRPAEPSAYPDGSEVSMDDA